MPHLNVEIKALCPDPDAVRAVLKANRSDFRDLDHQVDTYFHCAQGRLKLREGTIERNLIHYRRGDQAGPKRSEVSLYSVGEDSASLRELLTTALGVKVVVDKRREIHFVGNVKLHVDEVEGLGAFVEIEAIDEDGSIGEETLRRQCDEWIDKLGIRPEHLLERSYSDMLLEGK